MVTITNAFNGRTIDALNSTGSTALCGLSFCVSTQGDIASTIGETQTDLLTFVGCCLVTSTGVFICNVIAACTNCTTHTCVCGIGRQFAFIATGTLTFNSNLACDAGPAKYFMYHTTTPGQAATSLTVAFTAGACGTLVRTAGTWACTCCIVVDDVITVTCAAQGPNNTNYRVKALSGATLTAIVPCTSCPVCDVVCVAVAISAFGSCTALLVDDATSPCPVNITGNVPCLNPCCVSAVAFTYDYDANTQGGRTAAPCNNPAITLVAIGLCSAQYVVVTSNILRTKTNNISVVAALERNFDDPC